VLPPVTGLRLGRHGQPLKRMGFEAAGEATEGGDDGELPAASGGGGVAEGGASEDGRHFRCFVCVFVVVLWLLCKSELCDVTPCTRRVQRMN
jgi:hypothetical protein